MKMLTGRRALVAAMAASMIGVTAPAQEARSRDSVPQLHFFEWSELQFDTLVYKNRRSKLMTLLWDAGGGVFITPSSQGVSTGATFRQLDDFLYFSGLELPHSVLAIDADAGRTLLFAPARDARFESDFRPNDYPGRSLAENPGLGTRSGIHTIRIYDQLAAVVGTWVSQGRTLWINLGSAVDVEAIRTDFVSDLSPEQELLLHVRRSHPMARIGNAFDAVARLRMVKGPEEIAVLRQASELTVQAIRTAAAHVQDGIDERTLEAELEAVYKRGGAQRLAFSSIVKSGPNALWPWRILAAHYDRNNRTMRNGELVVFDVGAELDYYVSDVGRTFPVSGRYSSEQRDKLAMITAVSDSIIAAIRPGVTFTELMEISGAVIPPQEQRYMQSSGFYGHHIGLSVDDPSHLGARLEPGMVFTVEPWYYNHDRNLAVFIEDVVLVTEEGAEVLTGSLPRSPEALERLVSKSR